MIRRKDQHGGVRIVSPNTGHTQEDFCGRISIGWLEDYLVKQSENVSHDTQCFGYDARSRLSQAWTPSTGDCAAAPASVDDTYR